MKLMTDDQRTLVKRLLKELKGEDRSFWNSLNEAEKNWFYDVVAEMEGGRAEAAQKLKALYDHDFIRKPPTIREILDEVYEDPVTGELTNYWLGPDGVGWTKERGAGIYPYWRDALLEVLDDESNVFEWVLTGPIGGGKCVSKSTLITTDRGLESIEAAVTRYRSGDAVLVATESGTLKPVYSVHDEGSCDTLTVVTSRGYQLTGRADHRVRVLDNDLTPMWVKLGDLKEGAAVLLDRRPRAAGQVSSAALLDRAYVMGLIAGDGHVADKAVAITSADVTDELLSVLERVSGRKPTLVKDQRTKNTFSVRVGRCQFSDEMAEMFPDKAREKHVPEEVLRTYPPDMQAAFLQGLYDTDGYCDGDRHIQLSTASDRLSREVQTLLLQFGIATTRKPHHVKGYDHTYWKLDIYGHDNFVAFANRIGFRMERKAARLKALVEGLQPDSRNSGRDAIPGDYAEYIGKLFNQIKRTGTREQHKQYAAYFMARTGQSLTWWALQNIVEKWPEQVPEHITQLTKDHWLVDSVGSITPGSSHCYDLSVEGDPTYIADGFVTHNTTAAVIGQTVQLIRLSCLRDPHRYHGLQGGGPIVFTICNVTQSKAKETAYGQMLYILNTSPYFREFFPVNTRQIFDPGAEGEDRYAIQLPRNIRIALGARSNSAISANVMCAILDEMSFKENKTNKSSAMEDSEAFKLYTNVRKRIESRFVLEGKKIPSLLCNVSSKLSTAAFLEKHIQKVRNSPKVKVNDDSIYKMKPPGTYSTKMFRVMIGDRLTSHRVLADGEQAPPGFRVEEVPINFYDSFQLDLDGSIRDICGISTHGEQPLFRSPEKLKACINFNRPNPFNGQVIAGTMDNNSLEDYIDKAALCQMWGMGYRPKHFPGSARFLHLDLSRTGDCTGISMGCISEVKHIRRPNKDGSYSPLVVPKVWFDFVLRVIPPQNGEIDYSKIRQLIFTLRDVYNFAIKKVTADQYQSADMLQLLSKSGFEVDVISMDRSDEPYLGARMAVMEERIDMPMYEILIEELTELVHDTSKAKGKVDHRATGSKDVADSWCGVLTSIGMEQSPETLMEPPKNPSILMPVQGGVTYPGKSFVTTGNINYEDQLSDIKSDD